MAPERRVERRRLATRQRLVRSALALFASHGVYETTVEDITEAADVGKGTFYEHFPSKTAIIEHLLREGFQALRHHCRRQVQPGAPRTQRLQRLLAAQIRFFESRRDLLILFHQIRGMLKLQPHEMRQLQRTYLDYVGFLAEEIAESLDQRRYSKATVHQIACAMAGFVTGYLSYLVVTGASAVRARDVSVPCRIFLHGIAGNDRPH